MKERNDFRHFVNYPLFWEREEKSASTKTFGRFNFFLVIFFASEIILIVCNISWCYFYKRITKKVFSHFSGEKERTKLGNFIALYSKYLFLWKIANWRLNIYELFFWGNMKKTSTKKQQQRKIQRLKSNFWKKLLIFLYLFSSFRFTPSQLHTLSVF